MKEQLEGESYLTKGMTFLLALVCAVAVANLYYNQPLLEDIAASMNITTKQAGYISTFTQLGYALGVFLLVPLGDVKEKKRLILTLNVLVIIALLGIAFAPNLQWLYMACFVTGMTTCIPQIIMPLVAQLSKPSERGSVVGTVVSGALLGILLARTVSGVVGYLAGWRMMFVLAAVMMLILGVILKFRLPTVESSLKMPYTELLKSVIGLVGKYKTLREAALTGGMMFAVFSMFWTTLTFLLHAAPYAMNSSQIGLFGLFGAVGALGAKVIGRINDKVKSVVVVGACVAVSLVSYIVLGFSSMNVVGIVIGTIILDFGAQGVQVSNQTRIYSLSDTERSRINTVYIVSNFVWGAIGSSIGSYIFNLFGWQGVCIVGVGIIMVAFLINLIGIQGHSELNNRMDGTYMIEESIENN